MRSNDRSVLFDNENENLIMETMLLIETILMLVLLGINAVTLVIQLKKLSDLNNEAIEFRIKAEAYLSDLLNQIYESNTEKQ